MNASMKRMKTAAGHHIPFNPGEQAGQHWLMSRELGAQLRAQLLKQIEAGSTDDTAIVDFEGLQAMTFSFADEFIGKLLALREADLTPPVGIVVTGLAQDPLETIELVLERRSLPLVLQEKDGARLLGDDGHLTATYDVALLLGTFKASEIAEQLGITPQNANNRLKKLAGAGAVRRQRASSERGGKEFTYRAVH
jgi:DNA-binding MarR family transcriptional regulator